MTDPPSYPETDNVRPYYDSTNSTPRWVKVFGVIGLVLVLLFVVLQFIGGGHGPGRHMAPTGMMPNTTPSIEKLDRPTPRDGGH